MYRDQAIVVTLFDLIFIDCFAHISPLRIQLLGMSAAEITKLIIDGVIY
jgi:hypothetical protein